MYLASLFQLSHNAFVSGRTISDNIHIAQEITHTLEESNDKEKYVLAKLDMERAYDMTQQDFIDQVLSHF